jgi:hypothetical protein
MSSISLQKPSNKRIIDDVGMQVLTEKTNNSLSSQSSPDVPIKAANRNLYKDKVSMIQFFYVLFHSILLTRISTGISRSSSSGSSTYLSSLSVLSMLSIVTATLFPNYSTSLARAGGILGVFIVQV